MSKQLKLSQWFSPKPAATPAAAPKPASAAGAEPAQLADAFAAAADKPSPPVLSQKRLRAETGDRMLDLDATPEMKRPRASPSAPATPSSSGSGRKRPSFITSDDSSDEDDTHVRQVAKRRRRAVIGDDDDDDDDYSPDKNAQTSDDDEMGDATASATTPTQKSRPSPATVSPIDRLSCFASPRSGRSTPTTPLFGPSPSSLLLASRSRPALSPSLMLEKERKKLEKDERFKKGNEERYEFLREGNIRDAQQRLETDPDYDPTTLYIPARYYNKFSPFEKQFWDIKSKHWDMVIFFKKGKFYELYEKDADLAHRLLDLKVSDRVNMKMAGVPEASYSFWASKVIAAGYKVGRVDQVQTTIQLNKQKQGNAAASKVLQRELVSVLTSGTLVDPDLIVDDAATYLLAIRCRDAAIGVCYVEASTGEFTLGSFHDDDGHTQLETLLLQLKPKEVVLERGNLSPATMALVKRCLAVRPIVNLVRGDDACPDEYATRDILRREGYFTSTQEDGSSGGDDATPQVVQDAEPVATLALGMIVRYLQQVKLDRDLLSQRHFTAYQASVSDMAPGALILDGQTLLNLEVCENNTDRTRTGSLLALLDHCSTAIGRRLFKTWVMRPLRLPGEINARLNMVDDFLRARDVHAAFCTAVRRLPDLERCISRIHAGAAPVRVFVDVLTAFQSLQHAAAAWKRDGLLDTLQCAPLRARLTLGDSWPDVAAALAEFTDKIDLPVSRSSNVLTPSGTGLDPALDAAEALVKDIEQQLTDHLEDLRKRFGTSKLVYRSIGKELYQVEFPKGCKLPPAGEFRQMTKTGTVTRFWTPLIQRLVPELEEARETLEMERAALKSRVLKRFDASYSLWASVIRNIAFLDCISSLTAASRADNGVMCRPEFVVCGPDDKPVLEFRSLRHPTVKLARNSDAFVPNDTVLGADGQPLAMLLTGPNMGGKSTLLRQTCIAVIMAQIGCYVPASSARLSPVDRIFTRIGANDNILAGQSTFMVELQETSSILAHASRHSLVILDELGRGTSTYDGYSIAYAVLEHFLRQAPCRVIFSTHYHLLTDEFARDPSLALVHMACHVDEGGKDVTFLYRLTPGVCSKSYGMNVARLAGVPESVVTAAQEVSAVFEASSRGALAPAALDLHAVTEQVRALATAAASASADSVRAAWTNAAAVSTSASSSSSSYAS